MSSAATTRSQAKAKTTIRNTTPASPAKRSYAQALAAPALPLSPFDNSTRAISEAPACNSKIYHSTADPLIKLVVEDPFGYLSPVNTRPMPPHNHHYPASVAAAKFRATHAPMHFTACLDSTRITHWSYHTNSRWYPKDRSCAYCKEDGHITSYCALKRLDTEYQEAVLAAKTAAESLHTMARTKKENSATASPKISQTPTTTPTPSSRQPYLKYTSIQATDSEEDREIVESGLLTDTEF